MLIAAANIYTNNANYQGPSKRAGSQTQAADIASQMPGGDTVSISGQGRAAASGSLMSEALGLDRNGDNTISIDEIRQTLQEDTSRLQQEFSAWRISQGLGLEPPVELSTDAQGNVTVQGDHPDKAVIEEYFAQNDGMSNLFSSVSANASLYKAVLEYSDFAAAYGKDPEAAVAQYAHLFSTDKAAFSLLSGNESQYLFDGDSWSEEA